MRKRSDKRPNRKNDRKVLVAEESTKSWADSDSDSSSSSSASSDSEQEEVHCLMTNQSSDDEKFKAENMDLKNSSVEPSTVQLGETDILQIELSKLKTENESLRLRSCELKSENERLKEVMSSWTQSSVSLNKLCETQKPAYDRTGLGFNADESSSGETCTQSNLACDKFKKMNFVKASVIHNVYELVRHDDQILGQLNQKWKAGIGYVRHENSKSSWLKNRLDKEKAKAGSKSFVQNQQRRGSKKVKSEWRKAAVDSSIRSTTGRETPSSGYTRRPDEINADGNSSKIWSYQLRRGAAAAAWWPTAAAASEEMGAAEWVL
ncbi:spindle pole body component 110-like [Dorcoceras hygrometricum]|uniref:Spindle pole body component 110-like n=1 Tax=Dorcoceras hygrometricum TaxID=472368 RepID=A0A2Z7C8U9_9LAMI|nr:spindle pole body component 110-like [Dorcoceras hygrometricum]